MTKRFARPSVDPEKLKKAGEEAQKTLYLSWEDIVDDFVVPRYRDIIKHFKSWSS
ncbi:MAG: hypothetical protein U5N26_01060 [Candidatus Marinimicrobia bacterium]|nr:hypothetical protein [Candidatus Neomarinimicrobiota bacterium]